MYVKTLPGQVLKKSVIDQKTAIGTPLFTIHDVLALIFNAAFVSYKAI